MSIDPYNFTLRIAQKVIHMEVTMYVAGLCKFYQVIAESPEKINSPPSVS